MTNIEHRAVSADGGIREGALIYVDGVLLAIFSHLTAEDTADNVQAGAWFLEAGLGPCGVLFHSEAKVFGSLDDAAAWAEQEVITRA